MTRPPLALHPDRLSALRSELSSWFAATRRDLPWRQGDDLYGIWVSEIMLQQTSVQAVVPYWERFMARFPTVADLAAAAETEVLGLWSGLGYYSRARNLHAAARIVCREAQGILPRSRAAWSALPGVGPYASGAIASLGLGERVPALDANARRVIMRWSVSDPEQWAAIAPGERTRLVDTLGAQLVPADNPGGWNESLMELGALVCGARAARCGECPVRRHCSALAGGWVDEVPPPKKPSPATAVWAGALLVLWRGQVLLMPPAAGPVSFTDGGRPAVRADFSRLHGGMWGVPLTPWYAGAADPPGAVRQWQQWLKSRSLPVPPGGAITRRGHFSHAITRYRLRVAVWGVELDARRDLPTEIAPFPDGKGVPGARFFRLSGAPLPVSRMTEKALQFHNDSVV